MSIVRRIKTYLRDPYVKIGILIFLIAFLSLGIGYIIGRDWTPAPIVIEKVESRK